MFPYGNRRLCYYRHWGRFPKAFMSMIISTTEVLLHVFVNHLQNFQIPNHKSVKRASHFLFVLIVYEYSQNIPNVFPFKIIWDQFTRHVTVCKRVLQDAFENQPHYWHIYLSVLTATLSDGWRDEGLKRLPAQTEERQAHFRLTYLHNDVKLMFVIHRWSM